MRRRSRGKHRLASGDVSMWRRLIKWPTESGASEWYKDLRCMVVLDEANADDAGECFPLLVKIRARVPVTLLCLLLSVPPALINTLVPIKLAPSPQSLSANARPSLPLEIQTNS